MANMQWSVGASAARPPIVTLGGRRVPVSRPRVRATHGYLKQGAGYGYTGVKGLNVLLSTIGTPTAAPVVAAPRVRKGAANSARGAARLVTDPWPPPRPSAPTRRP